MRYPILPAGAFTAAFLVLVPSFWHWRAGNVPTLSLIAWLFTLNLIYGANSLAWSDNIWDKAPVWCDVSAKLIIGASTALPACTLCICKYLAMIGGNRTVGLNRKDRRRIAMLDFALCWGVPVIFMALHYIVQEHRHNIVQYVGCQPVTYVSIPGILIVWVPPLLLSVGTLAYAGIALYHFVQMRVVFSSVLQVSDSPMSTNRYIRLVGMSSMLALWGITLTSLTIWANTIPGLRPWVSWDNVHSDWNRADAYIWLLMSLESRRLALLFWWAIPVSSIIVFMFLGFGEDASKEYRRVGNAVMNVIIPSRVLPERKERLGGRLITSPLPSSVLSSSKEPPSRSSDSSYAASLMVPCKAEQGFNHKEFILPLPISTKTNTTPKFRGTSTISAPGSLSSLKPPRPLMRSRTVDSTFYFHPTASNSVSNHSQLTRFSMSDEHLAFGQVNGPSTPLSTDVLAMNPAFQELPPIQSLRSLNSMMGLSSHPRTESKSTVESKEPRWSTRDEKLRRPPLQLESGEGRLRECASGLRTVTVAEPREILKRGSVRVTIQGQEPHNRV